MDHESVNIRLFDPTKPVQTRDGRRAIVVRMLDKEHFMALVARESGDLLEMQGGIIKTYHYNGEFLYKAQCGDDLINFPPIKVNRKGWVNIYSSFPYKGALDKKKRIARVSDAYETAAAAKEGARIAALRGVSWYTKTVKIEWEEEQ